MDAVLLLLHILGATIWTGGHIVLSLMVLPKALREKSPERLHDFESSYEKIGIPAFFLQVITGLWLAYRMMPDITQWIDPNNQWTYSILAKLFLLLLTMALALNARLRVVPVLTARNLGVMAWHIVAVTIISILFVAVGISFRTGWFY